MCGINGKSTRTPITAVSCSVATSSSESLPNDGKKPNQPKRPLFLKRNYAQGVRFHPSCEACISAEVVFINLYWKNGRTGKSGGFCKHISGSLYNQAVEVIYQEAAAVTLHALYDIKSLARPE